MTGILPINKAAGFTSFKEVSAVRRITGEKKCGHTGTLDPQATGVLPVALGGATRFIGLLPDRTKCYRARFRTGFVSDTLDIWGELTEVSAKKVTISDIEPLLGRFSGKIRQLPPMYSALKKDGVRLYELARRGETVERELRDCEIFELTASELPDGEFSLYVKCSEGTYVRTLIDDIGACLGTGAVMTALERVSACGIELENCVSISELKEAVCAGKDPGEWLISVDSLLTDYASLEVTAAQGIRFKNGGDLMRERLKDEAGEGIYRVYAEGVFLGLGEIPAQGESLIVKRVYSER